MKIQLDTKRREIKLEDDVKLSEFVSVLKKLLPNGEWKEFTLATHTTITRWADPIVIKEIHRYDWERLPWYTFNTTNATYTSSMQMKTSPELNSGVYNVEI